MQSPCHPSLVKMTTHPPLLASQSQWQLFSPLIVAEPRNSSSSSRRGVLISTGIGALAAAEVLLSPDAAEAGLSSYNITGRPIEEVSGLAGWEINWGGEHG